MSDKNLSLLYEVSTRLADGMQLAELADICVRQISEFYSLAVVEIWTSEGRPQPTLLASSNKTPWTPPENAGSAMHKAAFLSALSNGQAIHIRNVEQDARHLPRFQGIKQSLSIPIRVRGIAQGVLHMESESENAFQEDEVSVFNTLASMLAGSLHSLQLVEQTKFSEEYLHAVLKASQDIAIVSTDRNGYIITCSEGTERIFGSQPIDLRGRDILTLYTDESLIRGLHEFLANPDSEEIFKKEITELRRGEHPLFLNLRFQKVRNYRGNVIGFLGITRDITETMKLEGRLRELSVTDELTGLYNQREFFNLLDREVEKYKRNHRALSLCFIDLDKFKQFNDKQGHLEGDQVLKKVAEFMRKSIRHHLDLAFRYGGDEFAIIMSEVQPEKGRVMAERIRMAVQDYFRGDITLSIGIAGYNSRLNSQQLVELADKAMYHAKTRGGNRITLD